VTVVTLIKAASDNLTVAGVPAIREDETTGPTPPEQGAVALRFGAELFEKLWQAEPLLWN